VTTRVQLLRLQLLRLLRASERTLGGLACWLEDRTGRSPAVAPTSVPPHLQGAPAHWLALVAEHAPGLLDPHPPVPYDGAPAVETQWNMPPGDWPARATTPVPAPPRRRFALRSSRAPLTSPDVPAPRVHEELEALAARSRPPRVGEAPAPATARLRTSGPPAENPSGGGPTRQPSGDTPTHQRLPVTPAAPPPPRPEPGTLPRMRRLTMFDPWADRSTSIEHPSLAHRSTDMIAGSRPAPTEDSVPRSVAEWEPVPPAAACLTAPSPQPWPSLPRRPHPPAPTRLTELLHRWREDLDRVQEEVGWSGSSSS
jgi:hypothetical protein